MQPESSISCVPTEILADIFDLVCHPTTKEHLILAQVCRAFRAMTLSMSHYWAYISNKQCEEWYNLQLQRSAERGLMVQYVEPKYHANTSAEEADARRRKFVQTIAAHSHRWSDFTYAVNYATAISQELSGLKLPRLRTLTVVSFRVHDKNAIQLLKTWEMPVLRNVTCSAPLLGAVVEGSPSLDRIQAGHITGVGSTSLLRALQHSNVQRLQYLSMTMYLDSLDALHIGGDALSGAILEMPSLKSLHVDVQLNTAILVNIFLKHVSMLQLSSLSVHITGVVAYGNGNDYAFIRALEGWLGDAKLEKLRTVDLSMRSRTGKRAGSSKLFDGIKKKLGENWTMQLREENQAHQYRDLPAICIPDVEFFRNFCDSGQFNVAQ